jgi:hypothetical protein
MIFLRKFGKYLGGKTIKFVTRSASAIVVVILLFVSLANQFSGMGDVAPYYLKWIDEMRALGPIEAFRQPGGFDQYPPLSVFGAFLIHTIFGLSQIASWKISGAISLVVASEITYYFTNSKKLAAIPVGILGIPTLWWGYADVHVAPFLLASLYLFLRSRFALSGFFFALSCLFKWQPIIFLPAIFLFMLTKRELGILARLSVGPLVVAASVVLVYGWYNPLKSIWLSALNHYFSAWGPNLYWIVSWVLSIKFPDSLNNLGIWGGGPSPDGSFSSLRGDPKTGIFLIAKIVFYVGLLAYVITFSWKSRYSKLNVLRIAVASGIIYWQLSPGVHTNHLFLLVPVSLVLFSYSRMILVHFICIYGLILSSLFIRLGLNGTGLGVEAFTSSTANVAVWLSFLSVLLSGSLLIYLFREGEMENKISSAIK